MLVIFHVECSPELALRLKHLTVKCYVNFVTGKKSHLLYGMLVLCSVGFRNHCDLANITSKDM